MDTQLISLFIQGGVGIAALFILREYMRNVANDNKRKDEAQALERDRNDKNHREFMLLYAQNTTVLAALINRQADTTTAVTTSETRVMEHVGTETERILVAMKKAQDLIVEVLTIITSDNTRLPRLDPALALLQAKEEAQAAAAEVVTAVDAIPEEIDG